MILGGKLGSQDQPEQYGKGGIWSRINGMRKSSGVGEINALICILSNLNVGDDKIESKKGTSVVKRNFLKFPAFSLL